jgi:hypothetical protein
MHDVEASVLGREGVSRSSRAEFRFVGRVDLSKKDVFMSLYVCVCMHVCECI